jgi:hypothetical protein
MHESKNKIKQQQVRLGLVGSARHRMYKSNKNNNKSNRSNGSKCGSASWARLST